MRLEIPHDAERFGANLIYSVQKVYELDSGPRSEEADEEDIIQRLPYETLSDVTRQMAVVVPVYGERIKLIEGVLSGIPNQCLTIVISNSAREPVDRFLMERDALETYARFARKNLIVVHQKDPLLAAAFADGGYMHLLGDDMLIKDGKAEGMLVAKLLAWLAGKKFVGFVDSDNFFPGAVYEYIMEYASAFALSKSEYAMARILWHSKPKIVDSALYFAKYGRTSVVTNHFLNRLISHYTGFETEVIRTGNAGEHALTLDLAMILDYATGYAVEPYHFVSLLEKFGGVRESPYPDVMRSQVEVFQIESRNPHLHRSKGDEHTDDMTRAALQVIHDSFLSPDELREDIMRELVARGILEQEESLGELTYYPPLETVNLDPFFRALQDQPYTSVIDGRTDRKPRRIDVVRSKEKPRQQG